MSSGACLTVTSKHKFLTTNGFAFADAIRQGDNLINGTGLEGVFAVNPDGNQGPTAIEDVVGTLAKARGVNAVSVPSAPEHLHGDGRRCNGNIDVVSTNSLLRNARQSTLLKHRASLPLCAGWDDAALAGLCDGDAVLVAMSLAAHGVMRGRRPSPALCGCGVCHPVEHGFTAVTPLEAGIPHDLHNGVAVEAESVGGLIDRFAGLVTTDKVVGIEVGWYSGHVYDLQTESGLYLSEGIITSNCRCDLIAVLEGEA
jgi:hypothetical protein